MPRDSEMQSVHVIKSIWDTAKGDKDKFLGLESSRHSGHVLLTCSQPFRHCLGRRVELQCAKGVARVAKYIGARESV